MTPEIELSQLFVVTKKYGETVSTLRPYFDKNIPKVEGAYSLDVPVQAMDFCREISSLGGKALIVGGSIRDAVIAKENGQPLISKDFDFEIYGIPAKELKFILNIHFGASRVNMAGATFEVVKLKLHGLKNACDVSIPRRDSKKSGEKGHKAFDVTGDSSMNIAEAALRRDLTINSIAYDPLTEVTYDPYGGIEDIKNGILRATDEEKFAEDPVRVLRIMQFLSRFTDFDVAPETFELCKKMVQEGELDFVSRERIAEEFVKLLEKGKKPSVGLEFARKIGFIERYWPELNALVDTPQNPDWHPEGSVWNHTLQVADAASEIADREIALGKISKEDKFSFVASCILHDTGKPSKTEFLNGAIRSYGHEEAGVAPAREFMERLFGQRSEITKKILPLVAEHLKPKEMWQNEVKKGVSQTNAIRRLAQRLAVGDRKIYPDGSGANIYLLSLLAEADQRGRCIDGHCFPREDVPELAEWQSWLMEKCAELKVGVEPPTKILNGGQFLKEIGQTEGGPWLGILMKTVYQLQLDGIVTTYSEAVNQAIKFNQLFRDKIMAEMESSQSSERDIWTKIGKLEDPRQYL